MNRRNFIQSAALALTSITASKAASVAPKDPREEKHDWDVCELHCRPEKGWGNSSHRLLSEKEVMEFGRIFTSGLPNHGKDISYGLVAKGVIGLKCAKFTRTSGENENLLIFTRFE